MIDDKRNDEAQEARINTDQREIKQKTKFSDLQPNWIRRLIQETPELLHLLEPVRKWKAPKGTRFIKYSTVKRREVGEDVRKQKKGSVKGQRKNYARKAGQ